jgi:hypothetical protein
MSMYCMRSMALLLAAQADERLALELEHLVLGDLARGAAGPPQSTSASFFAIFASCSVA